MVGLFVLRTASFIIFVVVMVDFPNIPQLGRKGRRLFYLDGSGNVEYVCRHTYQDADTSDKSWNIMKIIYDVDGNVEDIQELTGSVDGRASLGWL
jgi:hypothetical protein